MENLNAEQVKKWLEVCAEDTPYPDQRQALLDTLTLIKQLIEENERLKEKADRHLDNLKAVLDERAEENVVEVVRYRVKADGTLEMIPTIESVRQDVAREIFEEFECNISTGIRILKDCINDIDADQVKRHLLGRLHELCGMEKFIANLKKKYIGE